MDKDKKLRKVTQHVWNFIHFKLVLTSERPVVKGTVGINTDMIKLLRMVVWTSTYVSLTEWRGFLYNHYVRMTTSPKLFATYVIYTCYITKQFSTALDAYQTLLRTMSLVIQLALYSSNDRQEELLTYSQEIFIEFFENELKKEFKKQGGWNGLGGYLQQRNPVELFKILEKLEEEGKSPEQITKFLQMIPDESDPLRQFLSRGIGETEVENYEPTSHILKSLGFLQETKSKRVRPKEVRGTGKSRGSVSTKTVSVQEFSAKSFEQDSNPNVASATGVDTTQYKRVFQQIKGTVRPVQRITTRQIYLGSKAMIQDLRSDFQMLEELFEFVFGDTSTETKL